MALRAAISTAIPVVVGVAVGDLGAGLIATLGAFTARFGGGRPYPYRAVQLLMVAAALALSVAAGVWAAADPLSGVAVVSTVAVLAVWLCNALTVGPPGAYVFVLACAAGIGVSASHLAPWQIGLLVFAGGVGAWLVQMSALLAGRHGPEQAAVRAAADAVAGFLDATAEPAARHRAATALHHAWGVLVDFQPGGNRPGDVVARLRAANHALHVLFADALTAPPPAGAAELARRIGAGTADPAAVATRQVDRLPLGRPPVAVLLRQAVQVGSHTRRVMARVAVGVPLAGLGAAAFGVDRAYWAMAAAVLVLHQGADLVRTVRRGAERLLGTWIGLGVAALVLLTHPHGLALAAVLAVLTFVIELLVVRHYALASVFITASALTIATGVRQVDVGHLLLSRGLDTLIGCAVAVAVYLVLARRQEHRRLDDALSATLDAVVEGMQALAAGDAASLAVRRRRRELQRSVLELVEAAEAARAGSPAQRTAERALWPSVVAAEHLAYRTIAAFWAAEHTGAAVPAGAVADIEAEVAQLRTAPRGR
ncbi:FUSC family protein [Mycobacterium sp. WMMD1722]|uniref:FUSC family protein n=1 Tax=Mycobacterium sp. WMMD1722 TaxID=3404117 RepID=UPI003BF5BA0B